MTIPLCWPLPINHTFTFPDNIPLPVDANTMATVLSTFHFLDSSWLTDKLVFSSWLAADNNDSLTFTSNANSFFGWNHASTLSNYQTCMTIFWLVLADHLLAKGKIKIATTILAGPSVLVFNTFTLSPIDPSRIWPTSPIPSIPWTPAFLFHAPPQQVPVSQSTIPQTLRANNTLVTSMVSTSSLAIFLHKK